MYLIMWRATADGFRRVFALVVFGCDDRGCLRDMILPCTHARTAPPELTQKKEKALNNERLTTVHTSS